MNEARREAEKKLEVTTVYIWKDKRFGELFMHTCDDNMESE